ncbi:MAG: hypothetical protein C0602_11735 [Denitrovibrio sp.]|nr:MAG: hypothetical protein C0602_11735 [Denitrovibrio sp.]
MIIYLMKILYMPGLASIVDKTYDISKSCKLIHLQELADCTVFDYKKFNPSHIKQYVMNFDLLFGSSFGGYFAFYLSLSTSKPSISVNPSLYLDERIQSLHKEYPEKLSFIKQSELKLIKEEPAGTTSPHIHILMNMDDEVISAAKVIEKADKFGSNIYTYEKGSHESTNFQGDMLPTIKMILNSI